MSAFIIELFDKYVEETSKLHSHSNNTHEAQMKSIEDFQMAYEVRHLSFSLTGKNLVGAYLIPSLLQEQSKSEEQKLLADINSLVSKHITRQRELVCACS
jgi:kinesin family protein 11